jgi:hypothetical protein
MVKKANMNVKGAVSLIIEEDVAALKHILRNFTNKPPKTRLYIKKTDGGKK